MLSPRQYAAQVGFSHTIVIRWIEQGLLRGALKRKAAGRTYYEIPADAPPPELKPGPKPESAKNKPKGKATKKRA